MDATSPMGLGKSPWPSKVNPDAHPAAGVRRSHRRRLGQRSPSQERPGHHRRAPRQATPAPAEPQRPEGGWQAQAAAHPDCILVSTPFHSRTSGPWLTPEAPSRPKARGWSPKSEAPCHPRIQRCTMTHRHSVKDNLLAVQAQVDERAQKPATRCTWSPSARPNPTKTSRPPTTQATRGEPRARTGRQSRAASPGHPVAHDRPHPNQQNQGLLPCVHLVHGVDG